MSTVAFIMGTTCSGKSTFLQHCENEHPLTIGTINVGQMMRAKYPPEHFRGSAAPDHTEVEAWKMFTDSMNQHIEAGKQLILVDGQPRSYNQVQWALKELPVSNRFILFDCFKVERAKRLLKRFEGDKSSQKLGLERLRNDMVLYYVVLAELTHAGMPIRVIKTDGPFDTYGPQLLEDLLNGI